MRNDNVEIKEVSLLYKVYEVGMNAGWNKIDATSHIEEMHYNKETQCFESHMSYELYPPVTYNVTEGLTPGKNCVLEVMFQVVDSEDNTFTLLEDQECGRFYFTLKGDPAIEPTDYHPFVEQGKRWRVHGFSMGGDHAVTDYGFSYTMDFISHDGHEYFKLVAWSDNKLTEVGELREEKQRVYLYDTEAGKEYLIYDFSLNVGDTFYEARINRTLTVMSTGQMIVNGDTLKTLHLNDYDGMFTADWAEGIGSLYGPLRNVIGDEPIWSYQLAYVSGSSYWPFTFSLPFNGWWGQKLTRGKEDQEYEITHSFDENDFFDENDLHYELVPDPEHDAYALHVSGIMWLPCGGDLYIYCRRERTEDISAYKLYLQVDFPTEVTTCKSPYHVDLSFPFFLAEHKYIVVDERGEHPVTVRDVSYRPFIEEGKVWKVGWFPGGMNTAQKLDYYYFEGDSIIDGCQCKKMMCRHEANERWGNSEPWTEYVGAIYEKERRVYCVFPDKHDFMLLYDFATPIGEKIDIYDPCTDDKSNSCIIERRFFATNEYYKGYSTAVALYQEIWLDEDEEHNVPLDYDHEHLCYWIEGIGNDDPLRNVFHYGWAGNYYYGMSCTIGDEVLYYLPYLKDGVTPDDSQVKKQWIDFTHITKPRPKAPLRVGNAGESEENLTGEYSVKQLFVNLKILSGTYTVTLKDAADNEVYRKQVQTSSTIALNTDLTKYPAGTYTLVVENSEEQYTATLTLPLDDTAVRDIPSDQIANNKSSNSKCFDLSGRQLSTPPAKGIYIRDGKKVVVK